MANANRDLERPEALSAFKPTAALVNARQHEAAVRIMREESQLLEIASAVSRDIHLEPLLHKIMQAVTISLSADRSTLFFHDPETDELWSHIAQGCSVPVIRFPAHMGIAGATFKSRQPLNIADAYADPRFIREMDRRTGYRTRSILCMPITSRRGKSIGVLQALNKRTGFFTAADKERMVTFCTLAAIAIENARLFEEVLTIKHYNESILESLSNGVITVNPQGVVTTVNQAGLLLFRREKEPTSMIGGGVDSLFYGKNAWIGEIMRKVQSSGNPYSGVDVKLWLMQVPDRGDRRREFATVNLSITPFKGGRGESMGCLIMFEDITTEKRLRSTMARHMTKQVAEKIFEEEGLGGKMLPATVLFSDIRSFTTIAEKLGPQATVTMLNDYFSLMVDIILDHHGILDKFVGDAIMAVFGVPFGSERDADNAVRAAIAMIRALEKHNRKRRRQSRPPIDIGVGINTDQVLSGNIGSPRRMDYTVIGDGVNLASRLEGATKFYGSRILVSEFTVRELKGNYLLREIDTLRVKGKCNPVVIFEVLDHTHAAGTDRLRRLIDRFHEGVKCYRHREWPAAEKAFAGVLELAPHDNVSRLYLRRCEQFRHTPPPLDWDGVQNLDSK